MNEPSSYLDGPHNFRVPVLMGMPLVNAVATASAREGESVGAWMRDAAVRKLNAAQAAELDAAQDPQ